MDDLAVAKLFSNLLEKHPSLYELEKAMAKIPGALGENPFPLEHIFSGGVYVRQMMAPAGHVAIGKRHRHETCNMILKGEVSVYMGEDEPAKRIKAPFLFTSAPMTKKMCYFHEDSIFVNVHPTNETDLEKIENEFIIPEEEYLLLTTDNTKQLKIGDKQ